MNEGRESKRTDDGTCRVLGKELAPVPEKPLLPCVRADALSLDEWPLERVAELGESPRAVSWVIRGLSKHKDKFPPHYGHIGRGSERRRIRVLYPDEVKLFLSLCLPKKEFEAVRYKAPSNAVAPSEGHLPVPTTPGAAPALPGRVVGREMVTEQLLRDAGVDYKKKVKLVRGMVRVWEEGMSAKQTKFFSDKGKVLDEREVIDHYARLKAAEQVAPGIAGLNLRGGEKSADGGGITIIIEAPDWAKNKPPIQIEVHKETETQEA